MKFREHITLQRTVSPRDPYPIKTRFGLNLSLAEERTCRPLPDLTLHSSWQSTISGYSPFLTNRIPKLSQLSDANNTYYKRAVEVALRQNCGENSVASYPMPDRLIATWNEYSHQCRRAE